MMTQNKTVLVLEFRDAGATAPGAITRKGVDYLREQANVDWLPISYPVSEDAKREITERIAKADGVVVAPWHQFPFAISPDQIALWPKLRVLSGTFDNRFAAWVNIEDLKARRIALVDTSRNMTPTVAEFAFAQTLNLLRDIPAALEWVRDGKWQPIETYSLAPREGGFVYGDLEGRRIGLAGFGSINRRYAQFARAFDCEIMTCDPFVSDEVLRSCGVERVTTLTELASRSEIFVVGIPPTPTTLGIISEEVIRALPQGSLFVLVTRMAVVQQATLWSRIQANELRAAIDVFDPEPPPADAWFRRHPNCLCSPHIAGGVFYCHERCFVAACEDAVAVLEGRPAEYAATPWDAVIYSGDPGAKK